MNYLYLTLMLNQQKVYFKIVVSKHEYQYLEIFPTEKTVLNEHYDIYNVRMT